MSRSVVRPRCAFVLVCLSLAIPLAGCKDAPTVPRALEQLAGGEQWVAVRAPEDLPSLGTWLPYLDRSSAAGETVHARVAELASAAEAARADGRASEARALEREAERLTLSALARAPEPRVIQEALFALDAWTERVRADVTLERAPELAAALEGVSSARALAAQRLAAGDTTGALLQVAAASERIDHFTPASVALRVVGRAEERLRALPEQDPSVERALHLLHYARQEMAGGDPYRALRRALYALQLADGRAVQAREPAPCLEPGCGG